MGERIDYIKIIGIGLILNFLENIIQLLFFGVPLTKYSVISASVFAVSFFIIYELIKFYKKEIVHI